MRSPHIGMPRERSILPIMPDTLLSGVVLLMSGGSSTLFGICGILQAGTRWPPGRIHSIGSASHVVLCHSC